MDIYKIARERAAKALEAAIAPSQIKQRARRQRPADATKARRRDKMARYRTTPSGNRKNAENCHRWYVAHKYEAREYMKRWKKEFFEMYGMKYDTYNYRLKRGLPVPAIERRA